MTIEEAEKIFEDRVLIHSQSISENLKEAEDIDIFLESMAKEALDKLAITVAYARFLKRQGDIKGVGTVFDYLDDLSANAVKLGKILIKTNYKTGKEKWKKMM